MSAEHVRLTVYTRANCPLCDEALAALSRAKEELGGKFDFELVDIEGDERLTREYGALIPVVARGDEVLFIGKVSVHRMKMLLGDGDKSGGGKSAGGRSGGRAGAKDGLSSGAGDGDDGVARSFPNFTPRYRKHLQQLAAKLRGALGEAGDKDAGAHK